MKSRLFHCDAEGLYYIVDVKTHRADTKFNMPNLTSVERLARFYEDDKDYFVVLIVKYKLDGTRANVSDVLDQFYPREIEKINQRIGRFRAVREFWLAKPDE